MTAEPGTGTVKVTLPVEPAVAELLLRDEALRAWVGRFVSRLLSSRTDSVAADLTAEFRALRIGRTLNGLEPERLIEEGRDRGPSDGA